MLDPILRCDRHLSSDPAANEAVENEMTQDNIRFDINPIDSIGL
jgi:hypothetical protein